MPAAHNHRLAVLRIHICSLADTFGPVDLNDKVANDPDLEAEGQAEKIPEMVQSKIGQVKKVLGTLTR
jgi:hypothetical protein